MRCPLYTGLWDLMRGFVYAIYNICRAVGPDVGCTFIYIILYSTPSYRAVALGPGICIGDILYCQPYLKDCQANFAIDA